MKNIFPIIFVFLSFLSVFAKSKIITLRVNNQTDLNHVKTVGFRGAFALVTDTMNSSIFNRSDIEDEEVSLEFFDYDGGSNSLICKFWNPEGMNIAFICSISTEMYYHTNPYFYLGDGYFQKGDITIFIKGDPDYYFQIEAKHLTIPFIYSEPQKINLDEDKEKYDLKFKVASFQGEKLALVDKLDNYSITDFDQVIFKENEIICSIKKEKIEEVMTNSFEPRLVFLDSELGAFDFEFVLGINVQYSKPKQDVQVTIESALNAISERQSISAFETNISDISPLTTKKFQLEVQYKNPDTILIDCYFKKYEYKGWPMLLICENPDDDFVLYSTEIVNLEAIHYKYTFTIIPSGTYSRINIGGNKSQILFNYPQVLDFTVADTYTINYFMIGSENLTNLKFVEDSPYLICQDEK